MPLTLSRDEFSKPVSVGIINDDIEEDMETFELHLKIITEGAVRSGIEIAAVEIYDDDRKCILHALYVWNANIIVLCSYQLCTSASI